MSHTTPPGPRPGQTRGHRSVLPLLALAFLVVPLVEIWTILQVGGVIGPFWTIVLLVLDSALGAWLVRKEGAKAWRALREALRLGKLPTQELADGILILVGGTLLLTPGFVTDVAGFAMVVPLTRPWGRSALSRFLASRITVGGVSATRFGVPTSGNRRTGGGSRPSSGSDVIQGEVVDD